MICFAWDGFPQYAARCIGALVKASREHVVVVATKPAVPVERMEDLCGCRVAWIEGDDTRRICEILGEYPRILFTSGWYVAAFNRYAREIGRNGGRVIAMIDNNLATKNGLKEIIKNLRFRLILRRRFDGFMVPGKSGTRLLESYGVERNKIAQGMYAADDTLFKNGLPLKDRPKTIIYVGQFIERKNVRRMVKAFVRANEATGGEWTLDLYGCGPLQNELEAMSTSRVHKHAFVQPEQLAGLYREARAFCLPSLEEHWGLVVHEAALSGCVLLLSNAIGAAEDMLGARNGYSFDANDDENMVQAFLKIMKMSDDDLSKAQAESLARAKNASLGKFVSGVQYLLNLKD